jgi:hypothetical protein
LQFVHSLILIFIHQKRIAGNLTSTKKRNLQIKGVFGFALGLPNGLRYLRWGGDGEAVQLEKG